MNELEICQQCILFHSGTNRYMQISIYTVINCCIYHNNENRVFARMKHDVVIDNNIYDFFSYESSLRTILYGLEFVKGYNEFFVDYFQPLNFIKKFNRQVC